MVFNATFNNISVISWRSVLLVQETGVPGENHRPATSHRQTLSQNDVSCTPRHKWRNRTVHSGNLETEAKSIPLTYIHVNMIIDFLHGLIQTLQQPVQLVADRNIICYKCRQ